MPFTDTKKYETKDKFVLKYNYFSSSVEKGFIFQFMLSSKNELSLKYWLLRHRNHLNFKVYIKATDGKIRSKAAEWTLG